MSNSKWRKVLIAVAAAPVEVRRCELKCIGSAWVATAPAAPRVNECHPGNLADGAFQPLEYKWIEWFRFPRRFQPKPGVGYFVEQDVETLRDAILSAADACVELGDEHLYLYGYRSGPAAGTERG